MKPKQTDSWSWRQILKARDWLITIRGSTDAATTLLANSLRGGKFQLSDLYVSIFSPPRNVWNTVVWDSLVIPRHAFITRVVVQQRLLTSDRAARLSSTSVVDNCWLCRQTGETHQHLFFHCNFACEIWGSVLAWLGYVRRAWTLKRELKWFKTMVKGKHRKAKALRCALCFTVYEIWRERNLRRFQQKSRTPEHICNLIKIGVCFRLLKVFRDEDLNFLV